MQLKIGPNNGEIVAGGNEEDEDDIHQYNNNSLIICDQDNRPVVRWFHQKEIDPQIIISDFMCDGLALDKNASLYISDFDRVLQLNQDDKKEITVAGGNGVGSDLNQLANPTFILVDDNYSNLYIRYTKSSNNEMGKDAKEGIIFSSGNDTNTLELPLGLPMGHFGDKEGEIIIGENGYGNLSTQLNTPQDLVFYK
ncbi:unnamed protein product [Adineta steineri]|uniref:Uncharacterized protein n=1 Tax=Adineta steineri TaxID=433720 RepID=A0A820BSR2_9BILA|nr:unnamed protein product [Adineta steineri]CAF4205947.1 unnamed protein product [Adineta steineri]